MEHFIHKQNRIISYNSVGKANELALVLIHPFPFDSSFWSSQVEFFSKHFQVITYDLSGFGKSINNDGIITIDMHADDLLEVLNDCNLEKVTLCGLSIGGYVALRFAEKNPDRTDKLILANTTYKPDTDEKRIGRFNAIENIRSGKLEDFADAMTKNLLGENTYNDNLNCVTYTHGTIMKQSLVGICGNLLAMAARTSTEKIIAQFPNKMLVITSDSDEIIPSADSQDMVEKSTNAKMVQINNAGHLSALEQPEQFNKAVLNFLNS